MLRPRPCPPPASFRPAGTVSRAEYSKLPPSFAKNTWRKGARGRGLAYEKKCQKRLLAHYPDQYIPAPWFRFWTAHDGPLWCQPDGLILDIRGGRVTIVEIKLRHTSDAWWQIRKLYEPVLRSVFGPDWDYPVLEVVMWFDPDTPFPEILCFARHPHEVPAQAFGVHIWNGRQ